MSDKLEKEFAHFVEFGNLLDRRSRQYLVEYFKNRIVGPEITLESSHIDHLNDQYLSYLTAAIDRLLQVDHLLVMMQANQRISEHIVLDTLYWIRKTFTKVATSHPYEEEVQLLEGWAVTPLKVFKVRYPALINRLSMVYERYELDVTFYKNKFQQFFADETSIDEATKKEIERIFTDLLGQWDALLQAKILAYQLSKLEEEEEAYTALVEAKVVEYQRLYQMLSPVTDYLGWDLSRDLWEDSSLDIINKYDKILEDEKSIKELAEMLGNMREAEIEIEEETLEKTIVRQEWVVDPMTKAEIVGIHESNDLNSLVSSEVGLLSDHSTEDLFLKKYADNGLLTFKYEDRKLVSSKDNIMEVYQRVRQKEKGPFIICVDTSESMEGRPELIAKVLCLGILKIAIRENRRAYLINFSIGIKTIDLLDIANSLESVASFLKMSFYGGTDASLALYEALRQLKNNDYEDADVLMISDFIMYKIDTDILAEIAHFQQNKNTEFHSLSLSKEANADILQRFDTNWVYNPKEKGIIRELTRGLDIINKRE